MYRVWGGEAGELFIPPIPTAGGARNIHHRKGSGRKINSDSEKPQAYVTLAHSNYIHIEIFDETIKKLMEERDYLYVGEDTWGKDFTGEEKIAEMAYLRDIGIPFSGERGWLPADVFEYLVGQGKLNWPYKKISWSGPGQYTIVEHYRDSSIPPWKNEGIFCCGGR